MMRTVALVLLALCATSQGMVALTGCGTSKGGYCWGSLTGEGTWCWLTWDGLSDYAKGAHIHGGCKAFDGHDANYYCFNAMADASTGGEETQEGTGGEATTASGLEAVLQGLTGKSDVDCGTVCNAVGGSYSGYGMSSKGEVAYYNCKCGSKGKVTVSCTGNPFRECCKDKCAGTDCPSSPKGWKCPADGGCPSGDCRAHDWKDWVAAHNIYRCMHDVPAVVWDHNVYQSAYDTFNGQRAMSHSDSYKVAAPAGPAGENLFKGSGSYNAMDAVSSWYEEINNCHSFPGCRSHSGAVGHFTALIWHGDKQIGCLGNRYNLFACRYKGLDYKSCNTPNYGDNTDYKHNVFPRKWTYSQCKQKVKRCGLPVSEPRSASSLDATTGLNLVSNRPKRLELAHDKEPRNLSTAFVWISTAMAMMSVAGLGVWRLMKRRSLATNEALASSVDEEMD